MRGFRGVVMTNSVVTLGRTTVRARNMLAFVSGKINGKLRRHEKMRILGRSSLPSPLKANHNGY
jgi:hypothetical protein